MINFFYTNKSKIYSIILISVSLIFFNAVYTVLAECPAGATNCLPNPLPTDDPRLFIGRLIKGILGLSGSVALLMFVYGGTVYLTAQGENEKIQRAKNTIVWATVGLVVIFGSYAFLNYLFKGLMG